jgi:hypothetical protein
LFVNSQLPIIKIDGEKYDITFTTKNTQANECCVRSSIG